MRNRTGLQHLFRIRLRFSSFLDATTNKQVLTTHLSTSTTHYNIANILLPVWLDWNPVSRMGFHGTPTQGFGKAYSFPPMSASRPVENSLQPHFWQEGFLAGGFSRPCVELDLRQVFERGFAIKPYERSRVQVFSAEALNTCNYMTIQITFDFAKL